MPVKGDNREVRMRRSIYGSPQWSFAPPPPGTGARFRRWNIVLIVILVFFVLGVFVVAKAPGPASNAPEATKVSHAASKPSDFTFAQRPISGKRAGPFGNAQGKEAQPI